MRTGQIPATAWSSAASPGAGLVDVLEGAPLVAARAVFFKATGETRTGRPRHKTMSLPGVPNVGGCCSHACTMRLKFRERGQGRMNAEPQTGRVVSRQVPAGERAAATTQIWDSDGREY